MTPRLRQSRYLVAAFAALLAAGVYLAARAPGRPEAAPPPPPPARARCTQPVTPGAFCALERPG